MEEFAGSDIANWGLKPRHTPHRRTVEDEVVIQDMYKETPKQGRPKVIGLEKFARFGLCIMSYSHAAGSSNQYSSYDIETIADGESLRDEYQGIKPVKDQPRGITIKMQRLYEKTFEFTLWRSKLDGTLEDDLEAQFVYDIGGSR